jgi:low affinity Fe/Cu permease
MEIVILVLATALIIFTAVVVIQNVMLYELRKELEENLPPF